MGETGRTVHVVVMGVAGTGKTTVGSALAAGLGVPFAEGDDFHSGANRRKMSSGVPLTDDDRWPWLRSLRDWMSAEAREGRSGVVACSALRRAYRDVLREAEGAVVFLHLVLPEEVNRDRLEQREAHYMSAGMLGSQVATLEPLEPDEPGVEVVAVGSPDAVVEEALRRIVPRLRP